MGKLQYVHLLQTHFAYDAPGLHLNLLYLLFAQCSFSKSKAGYSSGDGWTVAGKTQMSAKL